MAWIFGISSLVYCGYLFVKNNEQPEKSLIGKKEKRQDEKLIKDNLTSKSMNSFSAPWEEKVAAPETKIEETALNDLATFARQYETYQFLKRRQENGEYDVQNADGSVTKYINHTPAMTYSK